MVNPTYTYDANGNMTAGAGRTVTYTSFNKAASIVQGSTTVSFTYDSEHARVTMTAPTGTTTYLNDKASGAMEEKLVSGGTTTWHDFLMADGRLIAEKFSGATQAMRYFVTDHLGSVAVVMNESGSVIEHDAYDPWGKRRNLNGSDDTTCSLTSLTSRGFTGHEHIDADCLINANARIYDPTLGRFMSPDSMVPEPFDPQSFNRYSYVVNNPLAFTDPTGHDWNGYVLGGIVWPGDADTTINTKTQDIGGVIVPTTCEADACYYFGLSGDVIATGVSGMAGGAIAPPGAIWSDGGISAPTYGWWAQGLGGSTETIVVTGHRNGNPTTVADFVYSPYFVHNSSWGQPEGTNGGWYNGLSTFIGGAGIVSSVGEYGSGAATIGTNLKFYTSGWRGNQFVKTGKIAEGFHNLGVGLTVFGAGLDLYSYNFLPNHGGLTQEKLDENLSMDAVSFIGPQGAALSAGYYLLDRFYPGGVEGVAKDYETSTLGQAQTQSEQYAPGHLNGGSIAFHPKSARPSAPNNRKAKRHGDVINPDNRPMGLDKI